MLKTEQNQTKLLLKSLQGFFALAVLGVLIFTLGDSNAFGAENYSVYENSDVGIRVDYSNDWIVDDSVADIVFFYAPPDGPDDMMAENILIFVDYLSEPTTLEEYSDLVIQNTEFSGFSVTDSKTTTLANNPAMEIKILMELEGQTMEQTQIITVKDDAVYSMAFTTLPETTSRYMPIFERTVNSFEILSDSESSGQEIRDLIDEANQLYLKGNLQDALSKIDTALILKPNHSIALVTKTQILIELGIYEEADKTADKLLEVSEVNPTAWFLKALTLILQEKYSESLPFIDEYLSTAPEDSMALSIKGIALAELGQLDESRAIIDKSLDFNPDFPFSLYAKGYFYYVEKDYDQAILFYDKAIALDPDPGYRSDKVVALMDQGKLDQAEEIIDEILGEYPTFSYALNNKGVILLDKGNNAEALKYFEKASKIEPNNLLFLRNKIAALSSSGITDLAQMAYNQILELDPNYDEPLESITSASTSLDMIENKPNQGPTQIPDWIRKNAEWWAQDAIGDSDFVSGIQYLIKEGIMTIPETKQRIAPNDSQEIPSWIKNNADWWAQGLISDDDFVKGIQFLIENGIMEI